MFAPRIAGLAALMVLTAACGDDRTGADSGPDAASRDAAADARSTDAGRDATSTDGGTSDTGSTDAGSDLGTDGATADAGSTDAGSDLGTDDGSTDAGSTDAGIAPAPTFAALSPDDGLASTSNTIDVTGTGFLAGTTATFGTAAPTVCAVASATHMTCTSPAGLTPGLMDVTFTLPAAVGGASVAAPSAYTATSVLNETDLPAEADYCVLQFPSTLSATAGTATPLVYGRIYEAGVTDPAGAPAGVTAELGYGPTSGSPTTTTGWLWFPSSYNAQYGNDDEFQASLTPPVSGSFLYTYRFSFDGVAFTYCDLDGAGSNAGLTFDATQLGALTVTP